MLLFDDVLQASCHRLVVLVLLQKFAERAFELGLTGVDWLHNLLDHSKGIWVGTRQNGAVLSEPEQLGHLSPVVDPPPGAGSTDGPRPASANGPQPHLLANPRLCPV